MSASCYSIPALALNTAIRHNQYTALIITPALPITLQTNNDMSYTVEVDVSHRMGIAYNELCKYTVK
jgi:hypothetical protein